MDATERTRLRALCEVATQMPWEPTEIRDGRQPEGVEELGVFAPNDPRSYLKPDGTWHGTLICRGMDGPTRERNAALIVAAVNALPALLDALDDAERKRDDAREEVARLTRLRAHDVESVRQRRADCERLVGELDAVTAERDDAREDLARIGRLVGCDSLVGVEIHAAVEHELLERDAARDAAERAERERDDARAEVETLRAEAALLREIIEGRTTPPTDAEIYAHWRVGGTWIVEGVIVLRSADAARSHRDQTSWAAVTWLPLRDGRPCAWPTVTP